MRLRSVTYRVGHPGYTGADPVADAAGVLDAYRIPVAHLVGVSAGGAFAQLVALGHPDRVPPDAHQHIPCVAGRSHATAPNRGVQTVRVQCGVDWADSDSVIEYLVEYSRMLAGEARRFDEARIRDLVGREVIRARDFAARQNHDRLWRGPTGTRSSAPSSSTQVAAAE